MRDKIINKYLTYAVTFKKTCETEEKIVYPKGYTEYFLQIPHNKIIRTIRRASLEEIAREVHNYGLEEKLKFNIADNVNKESYAHSVFHYAKTAKLCKDTYVVRVLNPNEFTELRYHLNSYNLGRIPTEFVMPNSLKKRKKRKIIKNKDEKERIEAAA